MSTLPRLTPIAACLATALALAPPSLHATNLPVANCNDSGGGSLRAVVGSAAETDTVDMSELVCGTISVRTGAIHITQNNLILKGPATGQLPVTGVYNGVTMNDRIFNHTGTGTLEIDHLAVQNGHLVSSTADVSGGCIFSSGSLVLNDSRVSTCYASADNHSVLGGGIYVAGNLSATDGTISDNIAGGTANFAGGGGALVHGDFTSLRTTIRGNKATGLNATGGGIFTFGNVTVTASTISGNSANDFAGIIIFANPNTNYATIINSTISGNNALTGVNGGLYSNISIKMQNSTIAFNTAPLSQHVPDAPFYSAGMALRAGYGSIYANLKSNLISNNLYGTTADDFSSMDYAIFSTTIAGSNNLIGSSNLTGSPLAALPDNTLTGPTACPLLGPLRDNGGPTFTHALSSHSPAIDHGGNPASLAVDQRGSPYLRISGGAADIGAYEVQQADIVFNNTFEGCPP